MGGGSNQVPPRLQAQYYNSGGNFLLGLFNDALSTPYRLRHGHEPDKGSSYIQQDQQRLSVSHLVQVGSGAYPASQPVGNQGLHSRSPPPSDQLRMRGALSPDPQTSSSHGALASIGTSNFVPSFNTVSTRRSFGGII
jgi:hypothetical protein